jgi:hypothetical protein
MKFDPLRPSPEDLATDDLIQEELNRVFGENPQADRMMRRHRAKRREVLNAVPMSKPASALPSDVVVMPNHYNRFKIEPVYFCATNELTFLESNFVKYTLRAPYKHADIRIDYSKAIRCVIMECKRRLGDPDWWKPYKSNIEACLKEEFAYGAS